MTKRATEHDPSEAEHTLWIAATLSFVTKDRLLSPSRDELTASARWLAAHLLRRRGWGLRSIGRALQRDYSTVSYLLNHRKASKAELRRLEEALLCDRSNAAAG